MKKLLTILFFYSTTFIFSQELSMDLVQSMKPRNIGPGGMSGRVTSIDVVNSNPDIMFAGTASGGLWKSTSGGIKWEPIFDKEITASIGAVAIQQSNPSVVWVGTEREIREIASMEGMEFINLSMEEKTGYPWD